ncbi:MAG: hypothetical protein MR991_02485 [Clostridiales bacterium]|nr:hypothetical protein [Clostridiales bacterium]MDD7035536.1 hypothetical protein [Bacillota bacterium]MDY2919880.1 hypothetical protein [Lentihominibacter sp.]
MLKSRKSPPESEITSRYCLLKLKRQIIILILAGFLVLALDMITSSMSGGITFISKKGEIYMMRPDSGSASDSSGVTATVELEDGTLEKKFNFRLEPQGSNDEKKSASGEPSEETDPREEAVKELTDIVSSINEDVSHKYVALPSHLSTGEIINWKVEKTGNSIVIIAGMILILFLLIKNRYAPLQKLQKEHQESIARQLPEFVNRLVLLLNAGLILNTAFLRSVEESLRYSENDSDYFCRNMKRIYVTIGSTNGSFSREFREFARSSGSGEVMRISNIISDNISKGVELTDKLCSESELLWLNRKKYCEEKGRIAETKLTLPLTIFLLVLVIITVSPALLEL